MKSLFLDACFRRPTARTPVWMMRQAGRFLPEYRKIRDKYDILTMMKTPDLATEVTLQPIRILGVDAAIIFSDILVVPEAMGMKLSFKEGEGPVFESPIVSESDVEKLPVAVEDRLKFVYDAIRQVKKELNGVLPLIGFCGAPWTLATYMIEGRSSKTFQKALQWVQKSPKTLHRLLKKVAELDTAYLKLQINAGASAVQIFDSWAKALTPDLYREFSLPYIKYITENLKSSGVPVIVFGLGTAHSLEAIAELGAHVVGVDATISLREARERVGGRCALQGNFPPEALLESPVAIRNRVQAVLDDYGDFPGHIFNLGHGVLPQTPVENAKALVDAVKEFSARKN